MDKGIASFFHLPKEQAAPLYRESQCPVDVLLEDVGSMSVK